MSFKAEAGRDAAVSSCPDSRRGLVSELPTPAALCPVSPGGGGGGCPQNRYHEKELDVQAQVCVLSYSCLYPRGQYKSLITRMARVRRVPASVPAQPCRLYSLVLRPNESHCSYIMRSTLWEADNTEQAAERTTEGQKLSRSPEQGCRSLEGLAGPTALGRKCSRNLSRADRWTDGQDQP